MKDPIVIDPPGFDQKAAWGECQEWSDNHTDDDGTPSIAAAFGADPGICSCPACNEMHWAWGAKQRCTKCGFEYPTDAWAMFSWGTQAGWRRDNPPESYKTDASLRERMEAYDAGKLWHPYFCYGYEHGPKPDTDDLFDYFNRQDWKTIMGTYRGHEKFSKPKPREMSPEVRELFERTMKARAAIVDHLGGPWKRGAKSAGGVIDCPACGNTACLQFSRAGINGHIHAACRTEGCVSWME